VQVQLILPGDYYLIFSYKTQTIPILMPSRVTCNLGKHTCTGQVYANSASCTCFNDHSII